MKRRRNAHSKDTGTRGRKTEKQEKARPEKWENVVHGYERSLALGVFADAGKAPTMTDVEVAVGFADLRGFTNYVHSLQKVGQDNRVQHFLRSYFRIFPEAVLHAMWSMEPDDPEEEMKVSAAEIRKLIIPTSYKNLGDGLMIVWELQGATDMRIQGLIARHIVTFAETLKDEFFKGLVSDLGPVETDGFSPFASELKMGLGLARGHAWRLDFGRQMPVDYAGSIVNLASRLQGLARPSGIVAQLGFSESKFRSMVKDGKGQIKRIPSPKGLGEETIEVWASSDVALPSNAQEIEPEKVRTSASTLRRVPLRK